MRSSSIIGLLTLALGCDPEPPRDARPAETVRRGGGPVAESPAEAPPAREVTTASVAGPSRPIDELTPQEEQRYLAALDEGRRLHRAGDYDGAMAALERALDVAPGDPRALSEQGWAALHAERLPEADTALRRAETAAADDDTLLASILYNRGRVAEAQGRDDEAVQLYQRSLSLRPHPATYRHLVGLPGGTRYVFGPAVRRLQGPYERIAELCAEERRIATSQLGDEEHEPGCVPDAAKGTGGDAVEVPRRNGLVAPWEELRFVETRPSPFAVRFHAALRTAEGWYVVPDVASVSRELPGTKERATRLAARTEQIVAGGAPEVVLEIETTWRGAGEVELHRVEILCGFGPSGAPSCTGALPRATEVQRKGEAPVRWSVERRVTPKGRLVLDGEADRLDEPAAALLGEHPLAFL